MDFGICVASKIDDVGYITHAENLGYSHAWVADSQMIWSDCYASSPWPPNKHAPSNSAPGSPWLGRVWHRSPPIASPPSTASAGRTFLGIGTGNTAMRLMGHKPMRLQEFREYLRVLRSLLHGQEVDYTLQGQTMPIRFMMPEYKFVELDYPIPIYVSGFGPKARPWQES
jgi:alkanesulfonate monooxygenase SsuD/methylene tetrahydromethanopterin reductase-like flavin-dependent oxidoreductase (luciferase family)